jgi:hypothetical protein
MFTTIVWATDGSEAAANALPVALDLVQHSGGKLVAVHAREIVTLVTRAHPGCDGSRSGPRAPRPGAPP